MDRDAKGLVAYGPGWAKLRRSTDTVPLPSPGTVKTRKVRPDEAEVFGARCGKAAGFGFPESLTALWAAIVGRDGMVLFLRVGWRHTRGNRKSDVRFRSFFAWLGGGTTVPS